MSLSQSSSPARTELARHATLGPASTSRADPRSSSHAAVNVRSDERLVSALAGGFAVAWGLSHGATSGKLVALLGSALVYRGVSGHCHVYQGLGIDRVHGTERSSEAARPRGLLATSHDMLRTVTVQRSADEVYRAWRDPETFARAMGHFASHTTRDATRTRWTLRDSLGHEHGWDAVLVVEEPGKRLQWQSVEDAPLLKNLTLSLRPAPGDRGTEMTLHLRLSPASGVLGGLLQKLLGRSPAWVLERALGNVKALLEAGEIPSLEHNPSARISAQIRGDQS
jgi:uncharacterized membrane protein